MSNSGYNISANQEEQVPQFIVYHSASINNMILYILKFTKRVDPYAKCSCLTHKKRAEENFWRKWIYL